MLTQAERRLKDALRKKKERQMAKLFTSEKEKGTNFMIYFGILCTLFFFLWFTCNFSIVCSLKRNAD